jgi:peptidoglycan/LPS O-acetylase OafA/YrhL
MLWSQERKNSHRYRHSCARAIRAPAHRKGQLLASVRSLLSGSCPSESVEAVFHWARMDMSRDPRSYIPQIDSLRAFAVLAVLVFHLNGAWLPGGFAGVDVFFVISGYVVSASLVRSSALTFGRFALNFYAKRILRIVPALLVCLVVTALLTIAFIPNSWLSQSNYTTLLLALVGLSNFSLMNAGDSYFSPRIDFNPATHTWSLGVEEQFYLIFPAIYFLWLRGQQRGESTTFGKWALPLAVLASLAYSTYASLQSPLFAYYSLASRFWELGFGALLFQLHNSGRFVAATNTRWIAGVLGSVSLLAIAVLYSSETLFPVPWGLAATLGSLLFIDAMVARSSDPESSAMRLLGAPLLVGIGKISYSLYLWHWPIYVLFRWTIGLETLATRFTAAALVFALAVASYRYLEVPIRHNPAILRRPTGYVVAGGVAVVLLSVGVTFAAMQARPYLTLSVTGNTHDWYSTPWPIDEAQPTGACPAGTRWRPLASGGVHEFTHGECARNETTRDVFVIGDSHAGALMTLLSKYAQAERSDVHIYNRSACSFLSLRGRNATPHCVEFGQAFTRELQEQAQPGDVVLLPSLRVDRLADQWGGVAAHSSEDRSVDEQLTLGLGEAEEWLRTIEPLKLNVIFVAPTPVFAAPAFRCSDWFNRDNPICRPGLTIERERIENMRKPALNGMQQLASSHPNVAIWDPTDILCPSTICAAMRDGRPLFFDGDHLSSFGNLLIYDSFRTAVDSKQLSANALSRKSSSRNAH